MPYKDKEKEREYKKRYNYSKNKRCPNCGKLICNISNKCNGCAKKGENNPMKRPEVAKKMADAQRGQKRPSFSGINHFRYGKKYPEASKRMKKNNPAKRPEVRKKMSEAKKGEKSPTFNNWSSRLPYVSDWGPKVKRKVLERDYHECRNCGELENLAVHHINYDKMNCDSTNLITLCSQCNTRANYDRKKWQLLYENQIKREWRKKLYINM